MPKAKPARAQPKAQDPVKVDPKHYKVEAENKQVRLLRLSYGPYEKSVMHGHPAGAVVFLSDGDFRFTYPDGKTGNIQAKAGEVKWFEAFQHLPENLSDKPFEAVFIELKK